MSAKPARQEQASQGLCFIFLIRAILVAVSSYNDSAGSPKLRILRSGIGLPWSAKRAISRLRAKKSFGVPVVIISCFIFICLFRTLTSPDYAINTIFEAH